MSFLELISGMIVQNSSWMQYGIFCLILLLFIYVLVSLALIFMRFGVDHELDINELCLRVSRRDSLSNACQKAYVQAAYAVPDSPAKCNELTEECGLFLSDAVYQYSMSFFENKILGPYENLINLFPPLGFLGTVIGMMFLFMSSDGGIKGELSSAGMGTALLSTIFALSSYVFFDFLKNSLNRMADKCIRGSIVSAHALVFQESGSK